MVPVAMLGASIGVWLFYIPHQYPDAYCTRSDDWDRTDDGLLVSSYYHLPKWLNWFTGDIAVHHIHHVESRIPNYLLRKCMEENAEFRPKNILRLRDSFLLMNLKLWDETKQKMVGF